MAKNDSRFMIFFYNFQKFFEYFAENFTEQTLIDLLDKIETEITKTHTVMLKQVKNQIKQNETIKLVE